MAGNFGHLRVVHDTLLRPAWHKCDERCRDCLGGPTLEGEAHICPTWGNLTTNPRFLVTVLPCDRGDPAFIIPESAVAALRASLSDISNASARRNACLDNVQRRLAT